MSIAGQMPTGCLSPCLHINSILLPQSRPATGDDSKFKSCAHYLPQSGQSARQLGRWAEIASRYWGGRRWKCKQWQWHDHNSGILHPATRRVGHKSAQANAEHHPSAHFNSDPSALERRLFLALIGTIFIQLPHVDVLISKWQFNIQFTFEYNHKHVNYLILSQRLLRRARNCFFFTFLLLTLTERYGRFTLIWVGWDGQEKPLKSDTNSTRHAHTSERILSVWEEQRQLRATLKGS